MRLYLGIGKDLPVLFHLTIFQLTCLATAALVNPVQLFDNTWLPILLGLVQVASLAFLVIYVIKTVEIAQANRKAAEATQKATEATLLSVRLSEQAVEEMRAARDAQTAPYVVVYLDASDFIVQLVMENLGQTAAYDIQLNFDPILDPALGPGQSHEWPRFMTDATPMLAPKQRISTILNSYTALINNEALKPTYSVMATYRGGMTQDAQKVVRNATYVLDVGSFYGIGLVGENDGEKAVRQLEKLTESIDNLRQPVEGMRERFDRGVVTTAGMPAIESAICTLSNLSTAVSLSAALRATWILVEDKSRARRPVPVIDKQLARRTIEQIAALSPYLPISTGSRKRVQSIMTDLDGLVHEHFRHGSDVEAQVMLLLDELEALLREQDSEAEVPKSHYLDQEAEEANELEN